MFKEPLARIVEKAEGADSPDVAWKLRGLADVCLAKGDVAQALELQRRADALADRQLALALATGSEQQKLNYLASSASSIDRSVTINVRHAPADQKAAEMALATALRLKGRVLDSMTDTLAALRRRAAPSGIARRTESSVTACL